MTEEYNKQYEQLFDDYVHKRISWKDFHDKDAENRKRELMKNGGYY